MAQLIVLGVADRDTAERALDIAADLGKQELLRLEDAAYVYKDGKGRPRIHQTVNLTGRGALGGAFWGTLIGLLFLNPLLGLAVGAASGAVAGRLTDIGVDDDMIKKIGAELEQDRAAVFLLADEATRDRAVEAFKPLSPTVLQTNLSHDDEQELIDALRA